MARSRRTRKGGKRNRKMRGGQSLPSDIQNYKTNVTQNISQFVGLLVSIHSHIIRTIVETGRIDLNFINNSRFQPMMMYFSVKGRLAKQEDKDAMDRQFTTIVPYLLPLFSDHFIKITTTMSAGDLKNITENPTDVSSFIQNISSLKADKSVLFSLLEGNNNIANNILRYSVQEINNRISSLKDTVMKSLTEKQRNVLIPIIAPLIKSAFAPAEAKTTSSPVLSVPGMGMAAAPAPTGEIESLMQFVNLLEQMSPGKIMPLIQTMQNTNNRIISQALMFAQMKRPFDEKQMAISSLLSDVLRLYKIAWMSAKDKMKFNKYTISILPILMPIVKDQMTKEIGTYI